MILKRFAVLLLMCLAFSTCALAQRADVGFVVGEVFASDTTASTGIICITSPCPSAFTVRTSHHFFYAGELGYRVAYFKIASLHVELPITGVPSAPVKLSSSVTFTHLTSIFVTPSLKVKLLPHSAISPFASAGIGSAHFDDGINATTKFTYQVGGGLDFRSPIPLFGFRAEIRDYISGVPNFGLVSIATGSSSQISTHRNNVLVGGGIVVKF
jgi:hypothetical protein